MLDGETLELSPTLSTAALSCAGQRESPRSFGSPPPEAPLNAAIRPESASKASAHGQPAFSVVVPAWNRADRLPSALESVLRQSLSDLELIVVDDGSDDETAALVQSISDPRVRYVRQEHSGVCSARNRGADAAAGRFLTFLDSDDEALPSWLEQLGRVLEATTADVVVCGALTVDPSRRCWEPVLPGPWGPAFGDLPGPLLAGTFALRTRGFREVGGYEPSLTYSENTELALRMAELVSQSLWTAAAIDVPLVVHYQRYSRPYSTGRYEAARYILQRHSTRLALDPRAEGLYHGIAGIGASRLGRRREACLELAAAVRADPKRLVHVRRLLQVASGLHRNGEEGGLAKDPPSMQDATESVRVGEVHALAVTYCRPEPLRRTLEAILRPEHAVASVTVVDNDPAQSAESVVNEFRRGGVDIEYLPTGENQGPAGGLAVGMEHLIESLAPGDWMVLIDDDDPPPPGLALGDLHRFACWLVDRGVPVGVVGISGGRLDRRRARFTRVPQRALHGPVPVDFIGGNQFPMVSVEAIRSVGPFRSELFFGFDDLEFGLRVRRAGFGVFADGAQWVKARERAGRTGDVVPRPARRVSTWRRYYSIRNLITVLRDQVGLVPAIVATLTNVFGRPLVDLRQRPGEWRRYAAVGLRAGADAWLRRLGRRMDPGAE